MHEDPIPSLYDLSGDLRITRFIRVPEIPLPQIKKVKDQTESRQKGNLSPFLGIDLERPFLYQFWEDPSLANLLTPSMASSFLGDQNQFPSLILEFLNEKQWIAAPIPNLFINFSRHQNQSPLY